jgi:uncharacterized membrane protein YdjX (TVP38/TMEM64 family)
MTDRRLLMLVFPALATVVVVAVLVLGNFVNIPELKLRQAELQAMIAARPVALTTGFILIFALAAAFVPGAAVFKVASGALFGLAGGAGISLVATLLGAVIGFLTSRYLARQMMERRFHAQAQAINRGVQRDGMVYLIAMRFNPLIPFFLINFGLGLTRMRLWAFVGGSFVGLIPASFVYANAGTELARIETPADILTVRLIGSLLLLSLMPLAGRAIDTVLRRRRGIVVDLPDGR